MHFAVDTISRFPLPSASKETKIPTQLVPWDGRQLVEVSDSIYETKKNYGSLIMKSDRLNKGSQTRREECRGRSSTIILRTWASIDR